MINTLIFLSPNTDASGVNSDASLSDSFTTTLYAPRKAPAANAVYSR